MEKNTTKIMVLRDTYSKNDKTYFAYFIKGKIRNKEIKASVSPTDIGGYTVLDIVFGDESQAELVATPFELKDEKTGQVITGKSLSVKSIGEDGTVYECKIKPSRPSDKALINMLVK